MHLEDGAWMWMRKGMVPIPAGWEMGLARGLAIWVGHCAHARRSRRSPPVFHFVSPPPVSTSTRTQAVPALSTAAAMTSRTSPPRDKAAQTYTAPVPSGPCLCPRPTIEHSFFLVLVAVVWWMLFPIIFDAPCHFALRVPIRYWFDSDADAQAREVLIEESNVQPVRCPVTVCGDIHGQFVSMRCC